MVMAIAVVTSEDVPRYMQSLSEMGLGLGFWVELPGGPGPALQTGLVWVVLGQGLSSDVSGQVGRASPGPNFGLGSHAGQWG